MPLRHGCLLLIGCLTMAAWLPPGGEPVRAGKPETPARTDLHGDPLPEGARARLGTIRLQVREGDGAISRRIHHFGGHRGEVSSLSFSPDGKLLASSSGRGEDDCKVRLWDIPAARELQPFGHPVSWSGTYAVAFSPDGKTLASVCWFAVSIWDVASRKRLRQFEDRESWGTPLVFTPDGKAILAIWDRQPRLLDPKRGKPTGIFQPPNHATRVIMSADGKFVASVYTIYDDGVDILDGRTGKTLRRLPLGKSAEWIVLALSPTRPLLAAVHRGALRLWDVTSGKQLRWTILPEGFDIHCLTFSPDGRTLAFAGTPGVIRLVEVATGEVRGHFKGHMAPVKCLAFSPDGRLLASGSEDTTILLWDLSRLPQRK
jgi:WD40 repeat protein